MSLVFDDITHAYREAPVLSQFNFEVKAGDITCLLGPSGGGKSTALRLAAGLLAVQSGHIEIDGELVASARHSTPPERRPIGMMFQENALFPHLTVAENVGFGLASWSRSEREERVRTLLELVDCDRLASRMPHELSGGQQQRVALIRSLAPKPRVLLMDEPYASVDITLRRTLREAARRTLKDSKTTTLMVTHDPHEAMEMADVIAVLDQQRIVQCDAPQMLFENPESPTVAALFGDAQLLRARSIDGGYETDFGIITDSLSPPPAGECTLVVRPSGLAVLPSDAPGARVADVRYVGDGWIAFLVPELTGSSTTALRVAIESPESLAGIERVGLQRRARGFYVFPDG